MVGFQENSNEANSFWLLGDSFLRAFYTIYDGENKRIGVVGDTEVLSDAELELLESQQGQAADKATDEDGDADSSDLSPILIYVLPALVSFLCILAVVISVLVVKRIKK